MKKKTKKMLMLASVIGAAAILSGCTMQCPNKHASHMHKKAQAQPVQAVEMVESDTVIVYQTYENADLNKVYAKMYTHSSHGGESKMGHIKFHDTDNGLKMVVDLKDMRPGVQYNVKLYQCGSCHNDAKCCNAAKKFDMNLPLLQAGASGHLNQTYMIQGISAAQLNGMNIYLERDGGYKAGWGKLEK